MSNRFLAGISEIFYASLSEKEILSFSKNKKVNPRFSVLFNQLILKGGRQNSRPQHKNKNCSNYFVLIHMLCS